MKGFKIEDKSIRFSVSIVILLGIGLCILSCFIIENGVNVIIMIDVIIMDSFMIFFFFCVFI